MKRILINATQPEEIRAALVDGQFLYDLDIENRTKEQKKANIYKGVVTRVEPSLEAAFVDYGSEKHGFLPFKEIKPEYLNNGSNIKEGTEVIIQVEKEERGNKGASITTFLSLAGRYLVLLPANSQGGGISRRIEGTQREELREVMREVNLPKEHSVIVRTAGIGHSVEELQWDINYLVQLWDSIKTEADKVKGPHFLFQESNIIIRSIRDYLRPSIGEVVIDDPDAYNLACAFINQVMPEYTSKIQLYTDNLPLFNHFQIERQIETAFEREVHLPSGGSIVIDATEALTAIDVNSARSTRGSDIEETALNTNLEAADEVARQMRLRDMGGLFVIDFIDMLANKNRNAVEDRMRKALKIDRARIQTSRISSFGLMELSRQRLRPSLEETIFHACPRCEGQGKIRGMRSLALSVLRLSEQEAQKDNTLEVQIFSSLEVCTFLLNEKRTAIVNIEKLHGIRLVIVPQNDMVTPQYEIRRIREQDEANNGSSYQIKRQEESAERQANVSPLAPIGNKPAIQTIFPGTAAPRPVTAESKSEQSNTGLLSSLLGGIASLFRSETETPKAEPKKPAHRSNRNNGSRSGKSGQRNNDRRSGQSNANDNRNGPKKNNPNNRNNNAKKTATDNGEPRNNNNKDNRQQSTRTISGSIGNSQEQENGKTNNKDNNNGNTSGNANANNSGRNRNRRNNADNKRDNTPSERPARQPKPTRVRERKEPEGALKEVLDKVTPAVETTANDNSPKDTEINQTDTSNKVEAAKAEVPNKADASTKKEAKAPTLKVTEVQTSEIKAPETAAPQETKAPEAAASETKAAAHKPVSEKAPETQAEVKETKAATKKAKPKASKAESEQVVKPTEAKEAKPEVKPKAEATEAEKEKKPRYKRPANDPRNKTAEKQESLALDE